MATISGHGGVAARHLRLTLASPSTARLAPLVRRVPHIPANRRWVPRLRAEGAESFTSDVGVERCNGAEAPLEPSSADRPAPPAPVEPTRRQVWSKMLAFMGPVLFIPLIDPVVSVVEAALLGNFASTAQLAATAPGFLVFNVCVFGFTGISVQALADASRHLAAGHGKAASETVSTALVMALGWGVVTLTVLQAFGPSILGLVCKTPEVLVHATTFLKIKSLALPAMLAVFTCNSAHLAQRQQGRALAIQVVTMTLAALSNVALIAFCKLGIAGAALASVVTQYAAAGMQLLSLWQLRRRGGIRLSLRAASWSRAEETLSRLGPLSVMYLAKTMAYSVLAAAASLSGTLSAAAHQAMWPVFVCCSFVNSPVEQVALAFVPAARTPTELHHTFAFLRTAAIGLGITSSSAWLAVCLGASHLLTSDPLLWPLMRGQALLGAATLAVTSLDIAAGGVLLSYGRGTPYAVIMLAALAVTVALTRLSAQLQWGITGIWLSLLAMILVRFIGTNAMAARLADPWDLRSLFGLPTMPRKTLVPQ